MTQETKTKQEEKENLNTISLKCSCGGNASLCGEHDKVTCVDCGASHIFEDFADCDECDNE